MPNLAISLHATTEEQRAAIVPPTKKYSLHDILEACRRFPLKKRSRITFEYVMLEGVNDSPEDARRLAKLLAGIKAKVNLIPLNAAAGIPFDRPSDTRVDAFAQILADRHVNVSVRKSRGRDIWKARNAAQRRAWLQHCSSTAERAGDFSGYRITLCHARDRARLAPWLAAVSSCWGSSSWRSMRGVSPPSSH
jgi:wyosine [tRNA(Phe)-imidazoG37] synthetase (radical SAM superfamily)